jgi:hypothetical protein
MSETDRAALLADVRAIVVKYAIPGHAVGIGIVNGILTDLQAISSEPQTRLAPLYREMVQDRDGVWTCPVCDEFADAPENIPHADGEHIGTRRCPHYAESSDQTPALRARIMELEQALVNHGEHRSPCLRRYNPQKPCTCGLSALLSSSPAERTET